jgi:hypothetical protein
MIIAKIVMVVVASFFFLLLIGFIVEGYLRDKQRNKGAKVIDRWPL